MTKNQIEYLKLRETERANRANESLTQIRDATNRELGFATLGETTRHNKETEAHNLRVLGETNRHNLATENYQIQMLGETIRHNQQSEQLEGRKIDLNQNIYEESVRHNQAVETETYRSNLAKESETYRSNAAREAENYRSNVAREQETHRSNVVTEQERERSNRATETLRSQELQFSYANLAEQRRYHSMSIGLGYSQLDETRRSNLAREYETNRSNTASEFEQRRHNYEVEVETSTRNRNSEALQQRQMEYDYTYRQNQIAMQDAQLQETKRHNREEESARAEQVTQGWITSVSNAASKAIPLIGQLIG